MNRLIGAACLLFALSTLFAPSPAASAQGTIHAAVAANFIQAFEEISRHFEATTGISVLPTFASTGSLYNQIKNGAPYDLFLSADEERPRLLHEEGYGYPPFLYARGQVVLWSAHALFCEAETWKDALARGNPGGTVALANPGTSPLGAVAMRAIEEAGLAESLKHGFVIAQTVAQSFQYASTGAVEAGFVARSALATPQGEAGCFYTVPEAAPVEQFACILTRTPYRDLAERFTEFLLSPEAQLIKERFGYQ